MAKLGSAEMVGQFSLGLAITAPIILFFTLQLRNIIATDTVNKYSFSSYFGSRIIYLSLALIMIFLVSLIGPYNKALTLIIILVGISKVIESLSELTHGYLQKEERMDYVGKSQIIKAILSVTSVCLLLIVYKNLIVALAGLIIVWFVRLITYDLRITSYFTTVKPNFNKSIKTIFILAAPLGVVSILNSINTNIPRYFLEYYVGIEELGYFSAIAYILVAGNLLIRPLSLVAAPKLANYYNKAHYK